MQQTKKNPDCCGGVLLLKIVIFYTIRQRRYEHRIYEVPEESNTENDLVLPLACCDTVATKLPT